MPLRKVRKDAILNHPKVKDNHKPIDGFPANKSQGIKWVDVMNHGMNEGRDSLIKLPTSQRVASEPERVHQIVTRWVLFFG
jgi:hypothetical protein